MFVAVVTATGSDDTAASATGTPSSSPSSAGVTGRATGGTGSATSTATASASTLTEDQKLAQASGVARVSVASAASGLPFMLGASGDGVASGAYGTALGRSLDLASTWADNNTAMVNLPQLQRGGEYGSWNGSLDVSLGAFDSGDTWAAAASGAYDARWSSSLTALSRARTGKAGTTFIRFAHEMNGTWYPWSVSVAQTADFISAWKRYRALQQRIFPSAKLVFCVNRTSAAAAGNWTALYPGAGQVDVLGVDYYNQYPYIASDADFTASLPITDAYGGPKGLGAYAAFARSVGLPLALPEWSGNSASDSTAFIDGMVDYFVQHAGNGPGQILYASQFNVAQGYSGQFNLIVGTHMPLSSARYKELIDAA